MKNFKFNSVIILFMSGFFIFLVLKDNFAVSMKLLFNANILWLLAAVGLYILYVFFEANAIYLVTRQQNSNYPYWKLIRLQIMTKFFNGITPFSSGGQPLQIYELKRSGMSLSKSTNVVVESFIIFQISIVVLGFVAVLANSIFDLFAYVKILRYFVLIGFIVNLTILIIVYLASINKQKNKIIIKKLINFLSNIKLIKNKDKIKRKLIKFIDDYYLAFIRFKKDKKLIIKGVILIILAMIFYFLIAQCIFNALYIKHDLNPLKTIVTGTYIFIMSCFIPIPGAAGGVELGFISFFANFVPKQLLPPAMILWRFITFYFPTVIGGIVYNFFGDKNKQK